MLIYAVPLPLLVYRLYRYLTVPSIMVFVQFVLDAYLAGKGVRIYLVSFVLDIIYLIPVALIDEGNTYRWQRELRLQHEADMVAQIEQKLAKHLKRSKRSRSRTSTASSKSNRKSSTCSSSMKSKPSH